MEKRPTSKGIDIRTPDAYRRPPSGWPYINISSRPLPSKYTRWVLGNANEPGLKV